MAPQSSNSGTIPPSLPPSVEEAYRRKCVQLKSRTTEVEDANDAARLRLVRIKRQVEKLRIERAFLLEQLAKRTTTNVEDSDGSPSPPPTERNLDFPIIVDANNNRKPKEKPLRIKRGHRKSTALGDPDSKDTPTNRPSTPSPGPSEQRQNRDATDTNGTCKKPLDAVDLFYAKQRTILEAEMKDSDTSVDDELVRLWKDLPEAEKQEYLDEAEKSRKEHESEERHEKQKKQKQKQKQRSVSKETSEKGDDDGEDDEAREEDVTMANYDTEENEQQADRNGDD